MPAIVPLRRSSPACIYCAADEPNTENTDELNHQDCGMYYSHRYTCVCHFDFLALLEFCTERRILSPRILPHQLIRHAVIIIAYAWSAGPHARTICGPIYTRSPIVL